jgi:hypothetical protein
MKPRFKSYCWLGNSGNVWWDVKRRFLWIFYLRMHCNGIVTKEQCLEIIQELNETP